jgi:hypothetical protein
MTPLPFPSPAWRRHLEALPESEPPASLWPRLAAARADVLRRRRRPWQMGAAAAAAALLAVLGARLLPAPVAPAEVVMADPGSPAPTASAALPGDAGLRRLDDEIALAYARRASDAEVAVLWQARARLIESLDGPAPIVVARL